MPITATQLTAGHDTSGAASRNTASVSPGGNKLILLAISASDPNNTLADPTVTGNGLTWVKVNSNHLSRGGQDFYVWLYRAMDASPSAGAITIAWGGGNFATRAIWDVIEFGNVDTTGTNGSGAIVQTHNNPSGDAPLTIGMSAAASTDNAWYGVLEIHDTSITGTADFTEIQARECTTFQCQQDEWSVSATGTAITWSLSGAHSNIWLGVGVEIKFVNPTENIELGLASETDQAFPLRMVTRRTLRRPVGGFLGCGAWSVRINHRGGGTIIEVPASSFSHTRALDDMSTGTADFATTDVPPECLGPLSHLEAWAYELELVRDSKVAWVGPLAGNIGYTPSKTTVNARDLFAWMERRVLPKSMRNIDICRIFAFYVQEADALDPIGISLDVTNAGIVVHRQINDFDHVIAADALRELAAVGVDWSVVGRTIRIRGTGAGDLVGTLLGDHVTEASVTDDGLAVATQFIVMGNAPTGQDAPVSGTAGGIDPDLGLVTRVVTDSQITLPADAISAAESLLAVSGLAPRQLDCTLAQDAPVRYEDLIPGNFLRVSMRVGLAVVDEVMMLSSVSTRGNPEQVSVTLIRSGVPRRDRVDA